MHKRSVFNICRTLSSPFRHLTLSNVIGLDGGLTLYKAVHDTATRDFPRKLSYELVPLVFGPLAGNKYTATVVANLLESKLETLGMTVDVRDAFEIKAEWGRISDGGRRRGRMHFTINMLNRTVVSQLDFLFTGIGSHRAGLLHREMQLSRAKGRAPRGYFGDVLNLPFNREGDEVVPLSRSRAVLLNLSELRELAMSPTVLVIGAAGGTDKIDAIRTVLKCKYISVLITDAQTAMALVEA
jgi:hypothetical protein